MRPVQRDLFAKTFTRSDAAELLKRAEPFREYGPNYCRSIAAAAADLWFAVETGCPLDPSARILSLRIEAKGGQPC